MTAILGLTTLTLNTRKKFMGLLYNEINTKLLCIIGVLTLISITNPSRADTPTEQTLIDYDFEADNYSTGPDTFHIFEHANSTVSISEMHYFSGYRALRIEDTAKDGDFPELQGYYPEIKTGFLGLHFALMTTKPTESFNIALAGRKQYKLIQNGISFWLSNQKGYLAHHPSGNKIDLFQLQEYQWYIVDVFINIDRGTYDLTIKNDYEEEIVTLKNQIISTETTQSSLNQYSFIGDLKDKYNAEYYIDEIVIKSSEKKDLTPFKAPGRRKFFVDIWSDYYQSVQKKLQCLPSFDLSDFGFDSSEISDLTKDLSKELHIILYPGSVQPKQLDKTPKKLKKVEYFLDTRLLEIQAWRKGCNLLTKNEPQKALKQFEIAYQNRPDAIIYQLAMALALTSVGDEDEAYSMIRLSRPEDERWNIILAMIAMNKNDFYSAEGELSYKSPSIPEELLQPQAKNIFADSSDREILSKLKTAYPKKWKTYVEKAIEAEQYYYALLGLKEYDYALYYADAMEQLLLNSKIPVTKWVERQGDAAFFNENYLLARDKYLLSKKRTSATLKLADTYFLLGEKEKEIKTREKIYGKLKLR